MRYPYDATLGLEKMHNETGSQHNDRIKGSKVSDVNISNVKIL